MSGVSASRIDRPGRDRPDPIRPAVFHDLDRVTAVFSLRTAGVSSGPYDSLNLGLSSGDDRASVQENRRRFLHVLGLNPEQMAVAGQVHGDRVLRVDKPGLYPGVDALVTTTEEVALCIVAADCAVVLLVDPTARIVAAAHSGWRGTVAEIVPKTIDEMIRLGADRSDLLAYVSPCISTEHFEVGEEVAAQFSDRYVFRAPGWARPHADLKGMLLDQLLASGLDRDHVEVSDRCTFAETQDFFSYRAENGRTGRMMGLICLRA